MADKEKEKQAPITKKNPFNWKNAGNALLTRRRKMQAQMGEIFDDEPKQKKGRKADRLVED